MNLNSRKNVVIVVKIIQEIRQIDFTGKKSAELPDHRLSYLQFESFDVTNFWFLQHVVLEPS